MNQLVRLVAILALCHIAESAMCYFCADTSSESGKNQCQTYYRTMNYYRKKFLKTNKFTTDKYVKNCTEYGTGGDHLCMVASIEVRKNVRSFIRDCSDGTTFFSKDIDSYFEENTLRNDNQSSCHYTGQGYLACVTLCDPRVHGNFCNGPVISSQTQCVPNISLLSSLLFAFFFKCSKML